MTMKTKKKTGISLIFVAATLFLACGVEFVNSSPNPDPDPDVNELPLPSQNFAPGRSLNSQGACDKLKGKEGECVEKISKMEYRPLITIVEQKYTVPVPNIIYTDVMNPQERPMTVQLPKITKKKVAVTHIKEMPETKTLVKIKEVIENVPVVTTDVVKIPKKIPNPRVTDQTVTIPDVKMEKETKIIKKYKSNPKKIIVEKFREEPTVKKVRRPILFRTPKYVNRTRVEYIKKVVEVPNVIIKKLRLPRPIIKKGEPIFVEMGKTIPKPAQYTEEYPEYFDVEVEMSQVKREPKTVMLPYKEKTRVVRPVIFEAPIDMPEKKSVTIERNTRVPGPEVPVPCGVSTKGVAYLPAACPACPSGSGNGSGQSSGGGGGGGQCPVCPACQMNGYKYPQPNDGTSLA